MSETKKIGLPKIISIVSVVIMLFSFVMYFLPFWTFPALRTTGVYDHENKVVYVDAHVEDITASLADFIWFPASSVKSDAIDDASLEVAYAINEYAGYRVDKSALEDFLKDNKSGKDYFANTEAYLESMAGEGAGKAKLGLNAMIIFPVFHMVLSLIGFIVCACLTRTPHPGYFSAVIGIWGTIAYLTQAHLALGALHMVLLIASILLVLTSAVSIYFSIVRIRKWLVERRIKLEKMGLR